MSATILIELKATDLASPQIKKTEKAISDLGKKTQTSMNQSKVAVQDTMGELESLGNRFRYLSMVTGIVAAGSIMMAKSFVDSAIAMEQATLKLGVMSVSAGIDMDKAKQAAMEFASTGLISVADSAAILANFLATGIGLDKSTELMYTFRDSAAVAKESLTDTLGDALTKTSLGFRIFQERQIDASGINTQLNQVFVKYARTLDTTAQKLSNAQRYQAMYNFYMDEGRRYTGAADALTNTFSGSLSKLSAKFQLMKATLGETLIPLVGTLTEVLTYASNKIKDFAQTHSEMASIIISGVVVFGTLIAVVATLGAIIPMLVRGFKGLSAAGLMLTTVAGLKTLAVIVGISFAVGSLIYLVLKATGQWDKWRNSMASLSDRIKAAINPFKQLGDTATEANEKLAKQLKNLEQSINLATRDFKEGMAEWAKKHDETVTDLKKQIGDLAKDYKTATDKIRQSFTNTMSDLGLAHARKTEDLQRDIDEEVSKGIWADQTRIRELQLSLKRENEDYARATDENLKTKDEQLAEEKTKHNEKLNDLQKKLDEELVLEQKHAVMVAKARTWPILDEIEKRNRAYSERLQQYKDDLIELQKTSASEVASLDTVATAFSDIDNAMNEPINKVQELKDKVDALNSSWGRVGSNIRTSILSALESIWPMLVKITEKMSSLQESMFGKVERRKVTYTSDPLSDFFRGLLGFQGGGIIPGTSGQAVPIIAHAGETVLPVGSSPITININNPTVRSDADIRMIADAVKQVISRQQYLRHFK